MTSLTTLLAIERMNERMANELAKEKAWTEQLKKDEQDARRFCAAWRAYNKQWIDEKARGQIDAKK